jgi:hypothetical protein
MDKMRNRFFRGAIAALVSVLIYGVASPSFAQTPAQQSAAAAESSPNPAMALNLALVAACKENGGDFAKYLTSDNAAAYLSLSADDRNALMQRFSLLDSAGRPLLSNDPQGHIVLRCEADDGSSEFRFGDAHIDENLAFIPVSIPKGTTVRIGLVREDGNWKLLSLGLLMIDIPQLEKQWAEQALEEREQQAIATLQSLTDVIGTYQHAYGKLPDSLAQLGPAKGGVSADAANLIDQELAAGMADGYSFRYRVDSSSGSAPAFEIAAVPEKYGKTGKRSFLLDKDGQIHAADKKGALPTEDDPVIHPSDADNS